MLEQKVSYRYARALLDTASKEGIAETVYNDIKRVRATLNLSKDLRSMTASPIFQLWKKKRIFKAIFSEIKISELTLNFLILLLEKRRGELIPSIVRQYEMQYNLLINLLEVDIISAIELTEDIKKKVIEKLSISTQMTILPTYKIDTNIKGGLLVRIDDWVFDATIKRQLETLFKKLTEGID
jgi:F-type H+-transporting ATPase subunit delta